MLTLWQYIIKQKHTQWNRPLEQLIQAVCFFLATVILMTQIPAGSVDQVMK